MRIRFAEPAANRRNTFAGSAESCKHPQQ